MWQAIRTLSESAGKAEMVERNRNSAPKTSAAVNQPADPKYALIRGENWPKVMADPFPHIIIDNALPGRNYRELLETIPPEEFLVGERRKGPNRYHRRSAADLLDPRNGVLQPAWKRFIDFHVGKAFYQTLLDAFDGYLAEADRTVASHTGRRLTELSPKMRNSPDAELCPALTECQISHLTAAEEPGSPLGPHVDREVALWAGLYYLEDAHDRIGGDLVLYRFRDPDRREYWRDQMIPPHLVEERKVIKARGNRLVVFLHSPDAVHGVTQRIPDGRPRQAVNLVCEFPFKIFDISPWRRNLDRFPEPVC